MTDQGIRRNCSTSTSPQSPQRQPIPTLSRCRAISSSLRSLATCGDGAAWWEGSATGGSAGRVGALCEGCMRHWGHYSTASLRRVGPLRCNAAAPIPDHEAQGSPWNLYPLPLGQGNAAGQCSCIGVGAQPPGFRPRHPHPPITVPRLRLSTPVPTCRSLLSRSSLSFRRLSLT